MVSSKTITTDKIIVLNETSVNYHVRHIDEGESMFIKLYVNTTCIIA